MTEPTCPHCLAGNEARLRPETGELVHDYATRLNSTSPGKMIGHTICHDDLTWKAKYKPAESHAHILKPDGTEV